jgi:hypothetical protein
MSLSWFQDFPNLDRILGPLVLLHEERFEFGRGSRERRTPLSEIATDTPPIWQRDTGQPRRCAMVRPRHEGTPYVIEVTLRPGKYELRGVENRTHFFSANGLYDFLFSTRRDWPILFQNLESRRFFLLVKISFFVNNCKFVYYIKNNDSSNITENSVSCQFK